MHHVLGMATVPSMERERELVRQEGERILARALDRAGDALDGLELRRQARVGPPADALAVVAGTDHVLVVGQPWPRLRPRRDADSVSHQVLHHARPGRGGAVTVARHDLGRGPAVPVRVRR
jgi:hypothetical protein